MHILKLESHQSTDTKKRSSRAISNSDDYDVIATATIQDQEATFSFFFFRPIFVFLTLPRKTREFTSEKFISRHVEEKVREISGHRVRRKRVRRTKIRCSLNCI